MAPSYDLAASILLCAEDSSMLGLEEDEVEVATTNWQNDEPRTRFGVSKRSTNGCHGDLLVDFPMQSDECITSLVEREVEHLPREDYAVRLQSGGLDFSVRRDAIDWILKVHAYYNFGPLTAYLAVNYLDRFLSVYELPEGKAWMTQLLSVACLSLAAKMDETSIPSSLDLQVCDARFVFEAKTIQRMELLVLSSLKWRMQAVTPFSFIDHFLYKLNGCNAPCKLLLSQSSELILSLSVGTDCLAFRPSEIAAAVAIALLGETHIVDLDKALTCSIPVDKERVLRCNEVIQSIAWLGTVLPKTASPRGSSVPQSPIGVLDAACLSYKSDDTTILSHACYCDLSPATSKRRKIRK